jgi:hypothetical protein
MKDSYLFTCCCQLPGVEAGKRMTTKTTVSRSLKATKNPQLLDSRHHLASSISIDALLNRVQLQTLETT